ncbi:MAG: glycerate kinase [Thermoflexaceae bacterium]|nr:glycerate kinase [Thermoflexaceae bacterium]
MRVLVAPQEFKGSLTAEEAADAIAAGIAEAQPGWAIDRLPMSDGGPGFIDAMRRAVRGDTHGAVVHDALGRRVLGRYVTLRGRATAVVEAAQANGLGHVGPEERDALRADTFGVGELILLAMEHRPATLLVGVGGSATTDGGAGMARALGARLLDAAGDDLEPGGGALTRLDRIEWKRPGAIAGVDVVVATDVTNPLTGANGAAFVFGPQRERRRSSARRSMRPSHTSPRSCGGTSAWMSSISRAAGRGRACRRDWWRFSVRAWRAALMWSRRRRTCPPGSPPRTRWSRAKAASMANRGRGRSPGGCSNSRRGWGSRAWCSRGALRAAARAPWTRWRTTRGAG